MADTGVAVIGAGVVGLAVAARLAPRSEVVILERRPRHGQETSSRNSEVIHGGMYYPTGSRHGCASTAIAGSTSCARATACPTPAWARSSRP
jgi:L-2-hydroxyglutarate oxidase LhgO